MNLNDIKKMKVDDLRKYLLDVGESKTNVSTWKAKELKEAAINYFETIQASSEGENTEDFKIEYEDEPDIVESESLQDHLPKYGSPEWQEYVMNQFREDELFEGCPKAAGLRRVAQELLGDVISAGVSQMSVINQGEDSRAVTLSYTVEIDWKLDFDINMFRDLQQIQRSIRTFSGMADGVENKNCTFFRHPAAVVETKAMGRAFKNALCLNITTSEEKMSGYDSEPITSSSGITEQMKKMIRKKAEHIASASNSDVSLFIKKMIRKINNDQDKSLSDLSMDEAKALIAVIDS